MKLGDTIAAAIGGDGSSRGMVRVSGPGAFEAAQQLCGARPPLGVSVVRLRLSAGELPAIAIAFQAPRSYSGEDTLELLVPGNRELLRRILDMLAAISGVRHALPGEFTARAFLHGKLTAEQAEGVGALIAARTQAEHTAAERLLAGAAGAEYREIADEIAGTLALVEAGIDFTDQDDVVAITADELRRRVAAALMRIEAILAGARPREVVSELPLVVLVGAPNAGKSTLFNALLRRERAMVSDVAGTTRDVIGETLELAALGWAPGASFGPMRVRLADLAGLDAAAISGIDRDAQRAARAAMERADVLLWCDPTGRFEQGEALPLPIGERVIVRVRTKADLVAEKSDATLSVCALDGWRLGSLVRAVQDAIAASRGSGETSLLPRHARAMEDARSALRQGLGLVGDGRRVATPEVVATCLRAALDAVGSVAGRISPDDVIGRIFATFCIGK